MKPRRVLVLCYGNIYRSPFAAAVLQARLGGQVDVRSAGFHARIGRKTPEDFIKITNVYKTNLERHLSTYADNSQLDWADLIVVMDRHNWDAVAQAAESALAKTVWLGAFTDTGSVEITDPYGRDPEDQKTIADRLHRAAVALGESLVQAHGHRL